MNSLLINNESIHMSLDPKLLEEANTGLETFTALVRHHPTAGPVIGPFAAGMSCEAYVEQMMAYEHTLMQSAPSAEQHRTYFQKMAEAYAKHQGEFQFTLVFVTAAGILDFKTVWESEIPELWQQGYRFASRPVEIRSIGIVCVPLSIENEVADVQPVPATA